MDFLPNHMFEQIILPKLGLKDLIRFSAVCKSWQTIAVENQDIHNRIPWLMISRDEKTNIGTFLSLSEANKIYQLNLPPLVANRHTFCLGSSHGYLILTRPNGCIKLFNPFSHKEINYPRCYVRPSDVCGMRWPEFYFKGASILSLPSSEACNSQFIIAGITHDLGSIVEICKTCDEEWSIFGAKKEEVVFKNYYSYTYSSSDEEDEEQIFVEEVVPEERSFANILFYTGQLHTLTQTNGVVRFALHDLNETISCDILNVMPMSRTPEDENFNRIATYLVESSGELLLVYRFYKMVIDDEKHSYFVTGKFLVYKLVEQGTNGFLQWVLVDNLEDQVLFLGKNSSLSISAKGMPRFKGNCIYFTDDMWDYISFSYGWSHIFSDNGIFYLVDGRVESFFDAGAATADWNTKPFNYHHFVWVKPNSLLGG